MTNMTTLHAIVCKVYLFDSFIQVILEDALKYDECGAIWTDSIDIQNTQTEGGE